MTIHLADGSAQERNKYAELWSSVPEYRTFSPGLESVARFMKIMAPEPGQSLIDIGCGEGKAGLEFKKAGLLVNWLDITSAGLDPEIQKDRFIETAIWDGWQGPGHHWDFGFCCDVLEHIPPEYTMLVVDRIVKACRTAWLQITFLPDEFGKTIGQPLHLTVKPYDWWLLRLGTLCHVVDARDLCGTGLFVVSQK